MIRDPKVIPGVIPLHIIDDQRIIIAKRSNVYSSGFDFNNMDFFGSWTKNIISKYVSLFDLPARVLRVGLQTLIPFRDGMIGAKKEGVFYIKDNQIIGTTSAFKGSRPLNICVDSSGYFACFGEYFSNATRESVKVFISENGIDWNVAWTFEPGRIRHIHGCINDPFKKGIWVLTGDSNEESGLWFTNNKFKTLECIYEGSQRVRAVEIIPTPRGLIVPMDSPFEKNFIQFFDDKTKIVKKLIELPGSAFHAKKIAGIYFVSTITEPSEVNKTNFAALYGSLDGQNWKLISKLKKDVFSIKMQKFTRYAEIKIIDSPLGCKKLIAHGRALDIVSNGTLMWEIEDIKSYLEE